MRVATDADVSVLSVAVAAEFGSADPLVVALAARLAAIAEGNGPAAVAALRGLGELAAAQRESPL